MINFKENIDKFIETRNISDLIVKKNIIEGDKWSYKENIYVIKNITTIYTVFDLEDDLNHCSCDCIEDKKLQFSSKEIVDYFLKKGGMDIIKNTIQDINDSEVVNLWILILIKLCRYEETGKFIKEGIFDIFGIIEEKWNNDNTINFNFLTLLCFFKFDEEDGKELIKIGYIDYLLEQIHKWNPKAFYGYAASSESIFESIFYLNYNKLIKNKMMKLGIFDLFLDVINYNLKEFYKNSHHIYNLRKLLNTLGLLTADTSIMDYLVEDDKIIEVLDSCVDATHYCVEIGAINQIYIFYLIFGLGDLVKYCPKKITEKMYSFLISTSSTNIEFYNKQINDDDKANHLHMIDEALSSIVKLIEYDESFIKTLKELKKEVDVGFIFNKIVDNAMMFAFYYLKNNNKLVDSKLNYLLKYYKIFSKLNYSQVNFFAFADSYFENYQSEKRDDEAMEKILMIFEMFRSWYWFEFEGVSDSGLKLIEFLDLFES